MKTVLLAIAAILVSVTAAVAQDTYRIRAGDTLSVEVLEDPSLNRQLLVTPAGSISFPFTGAITVKGSTTDQVAAQLASAISSNFAAPPNVFVSVTGLREVVSSGAVGARTITVYFMGEVAQPGARDVKRGTTFLQGLAQVGGTTNFAADKRIQLRRTNATTLEETVSTINYRALQQGARMSQNFTLAEGDVILVPQRGLFE